MGRVKGRWQALTGALLMLSGCTVGPDYIKPAAIVPAQYKEAKGWKLGTPRERPNSSTAESRLLLMTSAGSAAR